MWGCSWGGVESPGITPGGVRPLHGPAQGVQSTRPTPKKGEGLSAVPVLLSLIHIFKENAGIFCHTQSWVVIAECLLGNGDQAYEFYRAFMPSAYNTRAEVREIEPYVHCLSLIHI